MPTTDPDSRVMPNKEGGYAPNYTPIATTDGERGFIVDCDVLGEVNEGPAALPSVDRIAETFGQRPERFLTDAGNNSGQIMAGMEERGVEFYARPSRLNRKQATRPWRRPARAGPADRLGGLAAKPPRAIGQVVFCVRPVERPVLLSAGPSDAVRPHEPGDA